MRFSRGLRICFSITCLFILAGHAQAPAPNRTPPLPPMSPEQLMNARAALQEATEIARRSPDASIMAELVQSWIRIDREKAPGAIEGIYSQLCQMARVAADLETYQRTTNSAHALLSSYASMRSERVAELLRLWPEPPSLLGDPARRWYEQAASRFHKIIASEIAGVAPQQALSMTRDQDAQGTQFPANGRTVMQLSQSGHQKEALDLADQTILDFVSQPPDARRISSFLGFLRMLARVDEGRYLRGLDALAPALEVLGAPGSGGILTVGDRSVQLTAAEAVLVDLCRGLFRLPDLAAQTLNLVPGLKEKADGVAYIESVIKRSPQAANSLSYSIDGHSASRSGSPGPPTPQTDLYLRLRGQAKDNPDFVKQRLTESIKIPDQMNILEMLINRARGEDPDLASLALEFWAELVEKIEPIQNRAIPMQLLLHAYRLSKGKVSADLAEQGFRVLKQLAAAEKNRSGPIPNVISMGAIYRSAGGSSREVEASLVGELAVVRFAEAMAYIRQIPEDQRLLPLVRVIQALTQDR
jgi:hypothetical protein